MMIMGLQQFLLSLLRKNHNHRPISTTVRGGSTGILDSILLVIIHRRRLD